MANGAAAPAVEDTGLDALILLLRFHEIAVDPPQIRHQYGAAPFGIAEIVRCARQCRLKARAVSTTRERLAKTGPRAMLQQQFRLFYDQQKPVGVLFWAHRRRGGRGAARRRHQPRREIKALAVGPKGREVRVV